MRWIYESRKLKEDKEIESFRGSLWITDFSPLPTAVNRSSSLAREIIE